MRKEREKRGWEEVVQQTTRRKNLSPDYTTDGTREKVNQFLLLWQS